MIQTQTARRIVAIAGPAAGTGWASAVAFGPQRHDAVPIVARIDAGTSGAAAKAAVAGGKALLNQIHAADRHELGVAAELLEQEQTLTTIADVVAVLNRKDAR